MKYKLYLFTCSNYELDKYYYYENEGNVSCIKIDSDNDKEELYRKATGHVLERFLDGMGDMDSHIIRYKRRDQRISYYTVDINKKRLIKRVDVDSNFSEYDKIVVRFYEKCIEVKTVGYGIGEATHLYRIIR